MITCNSMRQIYEELELATHTKLYINNQNNYIIWIHRVTKVLNWITIRHSKTINGQTLYILINLVRHTCSAFLPKRTTSMFILHGSIDQTLHWCSLS